MGREGGGGGKGLLIRTRLWTLQRGIRDIHHQRIGRSVWVER